MRLDTGVREGDTVSVFYDSMIGKLIAWGDDRDEAARRLQAALARTEILGVRTNLAFLERLVAHPALLAGDTDTGFIEAHRADLLPAPGEVPLEALVAAAVRVYLDERAASTGHFGLGRRRRLAAQPAGHPRDRVAPRRRADGRRERQMGARPRRGRGRRARAPRGPRPLRRRAPADRAGRRDLSSRASCAHGDVLSASTPAGRHELVLVDPFHYEPADLLPDARLTALMPGRVVKILARAGDAVAKGQSLMILEAMKMEHTLVSPARRRRRPRRLQRGRPRSRRRRAFRVPRIGRVSRGSDPYLTGSNKGI